ncbi:MAG: TetR/AcrR family transcriptional regulator [Bacteroidales bacterium]|nr:TetR/AcrR family transcriptional regulator [Bacteroidales bacterium]MBO4741302.1 TetR/AcrR family transcriptional regulator [Bacteroidales bacterium]
MNENSDIQKRKITEKATELFASNGVKKVKMDTIAKELGMSKRTLYENYPSKEALLEECLQLVTVSLNQTIESVLNYEQDATKILSAIRKTCSSQNNIFKINRIFGEELYRNYRDIFERHIARYKKEHIKYLHEFLSRAASEGYLKPTVDVDFAAGFVMEIFDNIIFDRLHVEGFDRGDIMKNFWSLIFSGIMIDDFWQKCDDNKTKDTI